MQNNYTFKLSPLAAEDLEQIFNYIAIELCNPSAAIALINDFESAFDNICKFPKSCSKINNDYVKDKNLRKLIINNYIAFYREKNNEIHIVRVLYGMRNYENIL